MKITNEEKIVLIKLARKSIEVVLNIESDDPKIDPAKYPVLDSKSGVFVTIKIGTELRGCIGYITTDKPLVETIKDAATAAAFQDPRFPPLQQSEYHGIDLEISILSEPYPMNDYNEIVLGEHGLILEEHGKRGLLLPQVPLEHGMDKNQFLNAICRKAGLPEEEWKERKLNMYLFTATVFSEDELEAEDGIS